MKRMQYRHIAARLPKPSKEIMPKKCTSCSILLDVPCLNPVCEGHQNDSIGDRCRYCATNQCEALLEFISIVVCCASHESCYAELSLKGESRVRGEKEKILSGTRIRNALIRNIA
jgi:hypothetical protein